MATIAEKVRPSNLYSLDPAGPFRARPNGHIDLAHPLSGENRDLVRSLGKSLRRRQFEARREFVFSVFGVRSDEEILALLQDKDRINPISSGGYRRFGRMYGIEGTDEEVKRRVEEYGEFADATIARAKARVLKTESTYFEMTNDVQSTHNPVALMLMMANDKIDQKVRIEAGRKLTLMDLVASIDQRERQLDTVGKYDEFIQFLNNHVWNPNKREGESTAVYLLSEHDGTDGFVCKSLRVLDDETGEHVIARPGQKRTFLRRRSFIFRGHEIPVYVSERRKDIADAALKMIRTGVENPALTIEDHLGLEVVLDNERGLRIFLRHLNESIAKASSLMVAEDISDTLSGEETYNGTSSASSSKIRMLKFYVKMEGTRIEVILHTNETFINSLYQEGVAHEEYEINRFFNDNNGVPSAARQLFPEYVFKKDLVKIRQTLIRRARQRLQDPELVDPPD